MKKRKYKQPKYITGALFIALFALVGVYAIILSHAATPTVANEPELGAVASPAQAFVDNTASNGKAVKFGSAGGKTCTVSALLVNSCRPWVGEATAGYTMVPKDAVSQFDFAEKRMNNPNVLSNPAAATTITNQMDIIHIYHRGPDTSLSAVEQGYIGRPNTYLLINYKPAEPWVDANGTNATINNQIDALADTFNANRSHKIFLAIHHEPENDVSSGNCTGNSPGSSDGSPTDYVNMWHTVRARFDAKGVTNAIWVMNYMGYSGWDCLVPLMWPGNNNVDWVTFDTYGSGSSTTQKFTNGISGFYNFLSTHSDTAHDYTSKPWGLSEYGCGDKCGNGVQQTAIDYWVDGTAAIKANTFPRLKMYVVFDTNTSGSSQVGYDFTGGINIPGAINIPEQTAYNTFTQAIYDMGK